MDKFRAIAPDGNVIKLSRSLSGVEAILPASAPLSQRGLAQPTRLRSANAAPLSQRGLAQPTVYLAERRLT